MKNNKTKSYEKYKEWLKLNTESLHGKVAAITGSTGGLGKELSRYLAHLGASLILVNRNPKLSESQKEELLSEFPEISVKIIAADMADIESVKSATKLLLSEKIDIFISNAGAYSIPRKICSTGHDNVYQINFVSPYYMIKKLLPGLESVGGRVVIVGSIAHNYSKTRAESVDFCDVERASRVYGNAKRYLMYSAFALAEDFPSVKISVTHPGITFTGITSHYPKLIFMIIKNPMKLIFMKPEKAALSILSGVFCSTKKYEWIGPRVFDVWGLPSKKRLDTANEEEIKFIASTAERIYSEL